MTLDREERERRLRDVELELRDVELERADALDLARDACARITELEEALHIRRLRCEELEFSLRHLEGEMVGVEAIAEDAEKRAEGYRQATIILREVARRHEVDYCRRSGCLGFTRQRYCWRHR